MQRVLFMHQVSAIGGASYCMLALLKGLDRSKVEPIVVLRETGPLEDEIKKLGIAVYYLSGMPTIPYNKSMLCPWTLLTYFRIERIQKKFAKMLTKLNVDTVYLNNMMLYPYLKTAKELGVRTIMHVREHWPTDEHQIQMKRARFFALHYADALIAINQFSASLFPECVNKTTIVYDWFAPKDRYEEKPFMDFFGSEAENLKVFLFTGGLGRIKGTLEVVQLFSQHIVGSEYRLLMMGSGLDYKLKGIAGIIKRILMLTGWEPYGYKVTELIKKDTRIVCIPPTYKIVDIFLQSYCALSYFTIPHANLALAEAVALGTVAIAPLTEEALEYTDNGKGAVLFNINDKVDFMAKVNYVINNYDLVKEKAKMHAHVVKEMLDPRVNIEKLNRVLEMVGENTTC